MKTCSVCLIEKTETEYYKGYAKCKSCHYQIVKKYRLTDKGKAVRQKERRNAKESGANHVWQKKYDQTKKGKEVKKKYDAKKHQGVEGKARLAAKNAVKYALRVGKLVKEPCFVCGEVNTHGHHVSYEKNMRLSVTWLCETHHNEIHNPIKELL